MFSFARNGDVQKHETGFPTITRVPHCEKWQKVRKGGQPARARSLIHLNKAVDPSCYYDLMLLSICQNKGGKQPKLEIKD